MHTRNVKDKVALITGAGRSIGRGIAERLSQDGASVVIADLEEVTGRETAEAISVAGGSAVSVVMGVTSEMSVNEAVAKAREALGPISILINNAGLFASTSALTENLDAWHKSLGVMLTGPLLCSRAVVPDMIDQSWGRIVNISSVMAFIAYGEDVAYCSAKAGLLGLIHSLAAEFGKHGINVNAICPGHIRTPMLDATARHVEQRDGTDPKQFYEELVSTIPKGRLGEVEDIAGMTSFLCSNDADHVSGQSMHVNGGSYLT